MCTILQYGTGSSIAIIGFAIWPDLTRTQSLNYAIKTSPTVLVVHVETHTHVYDFLHILCTQYIIIINVHTFWCSRNALALGTYMANDILPV